MHVWLRDDLIQAIEINSPRLPRPFTAQLGEPEARERSGLGSMQTQWVYASRGLVLHVQKMSNEVMRIYGFSPCSIDDFRKLPWGRVESRRVPLQRHE